MAAAPNATVANAKQVGASAVFAGATVQLFANAVTEFNDGVDRLNVEWSLAGGAGRVVDGVTGGLAARLVAEAKQALADHLRSRYAALEADLDAAANETAGMLDRGPNEADWKRLGAADALPAASPALAGLGLTLPAMAPGFEPIGRPVVPLPKLPSLEELGAFWKGVQGTQDQIDDGTLLGLAIGLGFGGKAKDIGNGTILITGYGGPNSGRTMTFGHVIIQGEDNNILADPKLRAHEERHTKQWEQWGLSFIPAYLIESGRSWLLTGDAAARNSFEVGAGLEDGHYDPKPLRPGLKEFPPRMPWSGYPK